MRRSARLQSACRGALWCASAQGLERLCRYITRPAIVNGRFLEHAMSAPGREFPFSKYRSRRSTTKILEGQQIATLLMYCGRRPNSSKGRGAVIAESDLDRPELAGCRPRSQRLSAASHAATNGVYELPRVRGPGEQHARRVRRARQSRSGTVDKGGESDGSRRGGPPGPLIEALDYAAWGSNTIP